LTYLYQFFKISSKKNRKEEDMLVVYPSVDFITFRRISVHPKKYETILVTFPNYHETGLQFSARAIHLDVQSHETFKAEGDMTPEELTSLAKDFGSRKTTYANSNTARELARVGAKNLGIPYVDPGKTVRTLIPVQVADSIALFDCRIKWVPDQLGYAPKCMSITSPAPENPSFLTEKTRNAAKRKGETFIEANKRPFIATQFPDAPSSACMDFSTPSPSQDDPVSPSQTPHLTATPSTPDSTTTQASS
jgi:hypothetical protein